MNIEFWFRVLFNVVSRLVIIILMLGLVNISVFSWV